MDRLTRLQERRQGSGPTRDVVITQEADLTSPLLCQDDKGLRQPQFSSLAKPALYSAADVLLLVLPATALSPCILKNLLQITHGLRTILAFTGSKQPLKSWVAVQRDECAATLST